MIIAAVLLTGCSPKTVQTTQPTVTPTVTDRAISSGETDQTTKPRMGIGEEDLGSPEKRRGDTTQTGKTSGDLFSDVIFDFDSYVVGSDEVSKIEAVAKWMKQERAAKLIVEGHCDERGTVEYNLALGQKRADAIKDHLLKLGIESGRIKAVSFGKETPIDSGHTEEAWSRNRRGHFKVDQKG